ncbi:MAG: electron transfer flavoprotein subunit alpha/FixB family protein [Bacteroidota bacterium]|nr:electron transfer flavoprotein subunit alpha/FixB family protein [Bacteroidota bacterium]
MNKHIIVIAEHMEGALADITFEMLGKAREIADAVSGSVTVVVLGKDLEPFVRKLGLADTVLLVEHDALAEYVPETYAQALATLLLERNPWLVFFGATSMGLDISTLVASRTNMPFLAMAKNVTADGSVVVTSQIYGGKMFLDAVVTTFPAVISILPGAFKADAGMAEKETAVERIAPSLAESEIRTRFEQLVHPEAGDVDITQFPLLVSVGRGIQNKENLAVFEDLAEKCRSAVAASRPVVDQGWLPMTRQVGRSGAIVKPKAYLAFGISGAPEHVEGMKNAELIIAVNTDKNAPIFSVAHYGAVEDAMDVAQALAEKISGAQQ